MLKKRFLLVLMFFLIMTISAANAHDNITNDTDVYDNQNHLTLENSVEIGDFSDLNDEIGKISTGGNLTLKKDYAYNFNDSDYKEGIAITKDNIVIDGNGHAIDGAGQSRNSI